MQWDNNMNMEEELKAENDFLKMKIMLENGAHIHEGDVNLPAELENEFLRNVMEFERQFAEHKTVRLFDKIGRPDHFLHPSLLKEEEIPKAWEALTDHLLRHNISLEACSPNVSETELYRFAIEELFEFEMTDMNVPGMIQGFIYDEFHPDPIYDKTTTAVDLVILRILRQERLLRLYGFKESGITLNEHLNLTEQNFMKKVNAFKSCYESFGDPEIDNVECSIQGSACLVTGIYALPVQVPGETIVLAGKWEVELEMKGDHDYWYVHTVRMEGINF